VSKRATLEKLEQLLEEKNDRETFGGFHYCQWYPWQRKLLYSSFENQQTLLMAANQVGKTFIGAANMSYHLTGLYPDDWEGHKWEHPVLAWAAGVSAESTRDLLQNELLGPPDNPDLYGSGAIPRASLGEKTRKPQVPNGVQSVLVKHHTDGKFDGWSTLVFKAFEQGEKKFMGSKVHEIWLDEQPPDGMFSQCITRTINTGGHVTMTFTPEDGVTPVIHQFTKNRKPGMALIQATWNDAPHLTEERKDQLLAIYGEHEREMRSKGIPVFGSGPVFTVDDAQLAVDPFEIPDFWPAIAAIDFGWDHPTAVVWMRWDRDADILYVTDCYRQRIATIAIHACAMNARASCPVAWPHDGNKHDGNGHSTADQYRKHGISMLPVHFTNPLAVGEKGKGNIQVEPGINAIHERMQEGRFKVFRTCNEWFEEYRMYHRENGLIYALDDDLMSATRYAAQSIRYAEKPSLSGSGYARPFDAKLNYAPLHLV
jgi:phage terminase large subunit-like protein